MEESWWDVILKQWEANTKENIAKEYEQRLTRLRKQHEKDFSYWQEETLFPESFFPLVHNDVFHSRTVDQ